MANFEISWEAPEYEYREKSVSWYWISIIIAAAIIAFAVWQKNFLFGLFIVVAEVLFITWGNRPPRPVLFTINESGVAIGNEKIHTFKEFASMSIDNENNERAELIFAFRGKFKTPLKMLVPHDRLPEIREKLKTLVKEVPYEATLLDSIEKLLGF